MMLSMILSSLDSDFWSAGALVGIGVLLGIIAALALLSQRWLLPSVLGAVGYWLIVELIHGTLVHLTAFSDWHSYVAAIGISWVPLFTWVLYRAIYYEDLSPTVAKKRALAREKEREMIAARYVEHSPIYDEYTPRFD